MPITTLQIPRDGKEILLAFQTDESSQSEEDSKRNKLCVKIFVCDKLLSEVEEPAYEYFNQSEEDFHKTIRRGAVDHNHLITSLSTDPEWTPEGYSRNIDLDEQD